jgi:hypothetical protein
MSRSLADPSALGRVDQDIQELGIRLLQREDIRCRRMGYLAKFWSPLLNTTDRLTENHFQGVKIRMGIFQANWRFEHFGGTDLVTRNDQTTG